MSNPYFAQLENKVKSLLGSQAENEWLQQQTWRSIANYSQEEVYELIDAIERADIPAIKDELADWCFHLLIYAEMGRRDGHFCLEDIAHAALQKLTERHAADKVSSEEAHLHWQKEKYQEKHKLTGSILSDVPMALPALLHANKLLDAAKQIGFTFDSMAEARSKLSEELKELDQAIDAGHQDEILHEMGDVLFACVSLANKVGVNPEEALRGTSRRFCQRIAAIERKVDESQMDLFGLERDELLRLYEESKLADN